MRDINDIMADLDDLINELKKYMEEYKEASTRYIQAKTEYEGGYSKKYIQLKLDPQSDEEKSLKTIEDYKNYIYSRENFVMIRAKYIAAEEILKAKKVNIDMIKAAIEALRTEISFLKV